MTLCVKSKRVPAYCFRFPVKKKHKQTQCKVLWWGCRTSGRAGTRTDRWTGRRHRGVAGVVRPRTFTSHVPPSRNRLRPSPLNRLLDGLTVTWRPWPSACRLPETWRDTQICPACWVRIRELSCTFAPRRVFQFQWIPYTAVGNMQNCGMRNAEGKMRNGLCCATVIGRDVTPRDRSHSAFHRMPCVECMELKCILNMRKIAFCTVQFTCNFEMLLFRNRWWMLKIKIIFVCHDVVHKHSLRVSLLNRATYYRPENHN